MEAQDLKVRLRGLQFSIVADVRNPLSGPEGATKVYGPQKGIPSSQLDDLDAGLHGAALQMEELSQHELLNREYLGAAGGMATPFLLLESR